MDLADVERALTRPRQYFLEDGLWEITIGLWMAATVALPAFIGGAAANWSPVIMLLAGLALQPAVLAAKSRWVYPRTGSVTYPDPERPRVSLGLGPTAAVYSDVPQSRFRATAPALISAVGAVLIALAMKPWWRPGISNARAHLVLGLVLSGSLLFAAARWKQRRWVPLAGVVMLASALVAFSGLGEERALASHVAALAGAFVASGGLAFAAYRRRTAQSPPDGTTDGG